MIDAAKTNGIKKVIVPKDNIEEASLIEGVKAFKDLLVPFLEGFFYSSFSDTKLTRPSGRFDIIVK